MAHHPKLPSLLKTLIALTLFFIAAQISLLVIHMITAESSLFDTTVSGSLTHQILQSRIFLVGLLQFLGAQLLVYTLFVGLLWYLTIAMSELFSLRERETLLLGIALTAISYVFILSANYCYAPHSFFSNLLRNTLSINPLVDTPMRYAMTLTGWTLLIVSCLAISNLGFRFANQQNRRRHSLVLAIMAILIILNLNFHAKPNPASSATAAKPNIIIIGIDALRPDFVGFYNKSVTTTPHLDALLRTSTSFTSTYTPLPRTFPSWTGILTGAYPKHSGARGNNTELSEIKLDATLPKSLRDAGYETIFSTDDTRFNNTNALFGFDQVVTPPMGLNDFIFGTVNDFPLTNLIVPTPMGRWLFPYNYANHGTPITYSPDNYLQLLTAALDQHRNKPLFLAVHFTITHWPFYWFNDHLTDVCDTVCRYEAGIAKADDQVARLLTLLAANHLLDHAVVVVLSDHGVSLGLPGDRITAADHYQGNKALLHKLAIGKYANAPGFTVDFKHDYGIDTAHGYGGDVLSLTQYHAVLAFKGYGVAIGKPHTVTDRVLLLDVAPTVLDLVQLPALAHADGISLKSYLLGTATPSDRTLYLETSFSLPEIEKDGISVERVLNKSLKLFQMDPNTGLISIKRSAETGMNLNKQEAIIQGDWLLAQHPESERSRVKPDATHTHSIMVVERDPGFMVLVNLKTGDWTLELNRGFAKTAPVKILQNQLYSFYNKEITPLPVE